MKRGFHSIISLPPPAKKIEKEITFLHSFATEEICSASPVVENVQLLSDLSLIGRKNKELNFLMANFFASGGEIREWKTGLKLDNQRSIT